LLHRSFQQASICFPLVVFGSQRHSATVIN